MNAIPSISKADTSRWRLFFSNHAPARPCLSRAAACCLLLSSATILAQGKGPFLPTGVMNQGRTYHTATLLNDGRVLVAGGYDQTSGEIGELLDSSELYDPGTGVWIATGKVGVARAEHAATLLNNGNVLITGGYQDVNSVTLTIGNAQLYDPATRIWTNTAPMKTRRYRHGSVLLPNHKVLVFGGSGGTTGTFSTLQRTAEIYDPATGSWSYTGSLNHFRSLPGFSMLADGRLLVSGGMDLNNRLLKSAEIYDPATGIWTLTGNLLEARSSGPTQTTLPDGKVLVTGGNGDAGTLASCELFDPKTNKWMKTAPMIAGRFWHQATLLKSGRVLVTGSHYVADIFSPKNETWRYTWDEVGDFRFNHSATLLKDGRVLIAGGDQGTEEGLVARAEIYDPALDFAKPEIAVLAPQKQSLTNRKGTVKLSPVKVGQTGMPRIFRIKNLGNLPMRGIAVSIQGRDKSSFRLDRPSETILDPDGMVTFRVTFRPARKGNLKAFLQIRSNDADENPFVVRLAGAGQ